MPVPVEHKCSLGGERFTYVGTTSSSTWGRRLDGKTYGSWLSPPPLVVCPNGFIEYAKDYDPAELKKVRAILRDPGFAAIAKETSYFRLGYIFERLGKPLEQQWWPALQASWQVDGDAERHRAYQQRFLDIVDRAIAAHGDHDDEWWAMQALAANAERQLGLFDAAQTRLAKLPLSDLKGEQLGYNDRVKLLMMLVARRDASLEPDEALPPIVRDQKARGINASNVDH
jgi:hypothetical protein